MGDGALATGPKLPRPSSTLPSRRWRSPELAAGCWGSSAATVAPGPRGNLRVGFPRLGQLPQNRRRGPQAPVAAHERRAGVVGASEMATGVVVGSAARSSPPLGPKAEPAPGIAFDDIGKSTLTGSQT
jgi:hypothetical protein